VRNNGGNDQTDPKSTSILDWDNANTTRLLNSLTAIDAHERQSFNELRGTVVSRRIFIRSQLVERVMTSSWPLLLAICTRLAESMTSVEGQNRIIFWASSYSLNCAMHR